MTIALRTILRAKGWGAITVRPGDGVFEVADTLAAKRIGAAIVLEDGGRIAGIVSERDIVTALSQHHEAIAALVARDIMSQDVVTFTPDNTTHEAMAFMTNHRSRHIPIVEDGKLCGMISIGDVVKHRLEEAAMNEDELRAYVMQSGIGGFEGGARM